MSLDDLDYNDPTVRKEVRLFLLNYEVFAAQWWTGWISNAYLQDRAAAFFAWKVNRKTRRFFMGKQMERELKEA